MSSNHSRLQRRHSPLTALTRGVGLSQTAYKPPRFLPGPPGSSDRSPYRPPGHGNQPFMHNGPGALSHTHPLGNTWRGRTKKTPIFRFTLFCAGHRCLTPPAARVLREQREERAPGGLQPEKLRLEPRAPISLFWGPVGNQEKVRWSLGVAEGKEAGARPGQLAV